MVKTAGKPVDPDLSLADLLERVTQQIRQGQVVDLETLRLECPQHAGRLGEMLPVLEFLADLSECGADPSAHAVLAGRVMPPREGESRQGLLGDFRLIREIGCGGMGVVYEAEQVSLGRRVALKVLPFAAMLDPRQLARFENETRAAALIDHPNVVQVYSVGSDRGVHYYAMQYIEGETLATLIAGLRQERGLDTAAGGEPGATATEPWLAHLGEREAAADQVSGAIAAATEAAVSQHAPPRPADTEPLGGAHVSTGNLHRRREYYRVIARLGIQAAEALEHAHQMGIVHRDIKPMNLLINSSGHLWVTDFGLAMTKASTTLTVTGDVLGTPRYMSPEQVAGDHRALDHRTDIYSLGVTLYELLTLHPAFAETDRNRLLRLIADEEPPRAREFDKSAPRELETIVRKAMAKEPDARYGSARELADDLQRFLDDKPILARRPSTIDRMTKWIYRHRSAMAIVAVMLVIAAIIGPLVAAKQSQLRRRAEQGEAQAEENAASAQRNYEAARDAVKEMLARVADERVGAIPEMKDVRRQLLEDSVAFYDRLLGMNPRDPLAYFERGYVCSLLARYENALADYGKAVELAPDVAEFHVRLGGLLNDCHDETYRDSRRGFAHVKRAVELDPGNIDYRIQLAKAHFLRAEYAEGRAELDRAAAMGPESTEHYLVLAQQYDLLDDARAVLACIEKALALNPSLDDHYLWLGRALAGLGDRKGALAAADKAYQVAMQRPLDSERATRFSVLLWQLREGEKAYAVLSKAIEDNPKPNDTSAWKLHDLRANFYCSRKMYAEALADYNRSIELASFHPGIYVARALVHFRLKNYDNTLADIATAIEMERGFTIGRFFPTVVASCPDERLQKGMLELADRRVELTKGTVAGHLDRAFLYEALGRMDEARVDYEKLIETHPNDALHYNARGLAYLRLHDFEKAVADFSQAMKLDQREPAFYANRADTYNNMGEWAKAQADYDQAIRLEPLISSIYTNRAEAYGRGEEAKALADLDQAIWLAPARARCYQARGQTYFEMGDFDKALADFSEALRLEPNSGYHSAYHSEYPYEDRGFTYLEKGDFDNALAEFSKAFELKPDVLRWSSRALARLRAGHVDDYRMDCAEMIQRVEQTNEPGAGWRVAWTCAVAPDAITDWPKAVALAEEAAKGNPKLPSYACILGAVLYRAGRFEEALWFLSQADLLVEEPGTEATKSCHVYTWLFLAMVHHQLGFPEEARIWFDMAVALSDKVLTWSPKASRDEADVGIRALYRGRSLTFKPICDEAEALLKSAPAARLPKPVAVESGNSARMQLARRIALSEELSARLVELRPDDGQLWIEWGSVFALRSRWAEAVEAYLRGVGDDSIGDETFEAAGAMLLAGNEAAYHQFCAAMAAQIGQQADPTALHCLARTVTVGPSGIAPEQAVAWAERAVADQENAWHLHALAMAHYRAGNFAETVRVCEKSSGHRWTGQLLNRLLSAMAHHQLGKSALARLLLRGAELMARDWMPL